MVSKTFLENAAIISCKRVKYQVLEAEKGLQDSTGLINLHVMYHMLFVSQQRQFRWGRVILL